MYNRLRWHTCTFLFMNFMARSVVDAVDEALLETFETPGADFATSSLLVLPARFLSPGSRLSMVT